LPAPQAKAPASEVELPVTPVDPMENVNTVLEEIRSAQAAEPDNFHGQVRPLDTWRKHHPDAW
jgi:hypothetical protein